MKRGPSMTTDIPERLIDGQRGQRYGEVLAAYLTDEGIQAHVYGTQMLNDCPQELWEQLTPTRSPRRCRHCWSSSMALDTGCSTASAPRPSLSSR